MIARSSLIIGPARIVRSTGTVHVKDPFTVDLVKSTFPVNLEGYGKIDERDDDMIVTCSFTPDGRWDSNTRGFLWPYLNPTIGSDPFGSSDTPTVIHDSNSHLHTIKASAVTQMPSITLSSVATMIGQATITGIRGSAKDWNDADGIYTAAASCGTFTDSAFTVAAIKTQDYTGAWGSVTGFTSIKTESGWSIDFETGIEYIKVDEVGTCKATLTNVSVMAKCTPLGMTLADVLAALDFQESGSARGKSGNLLGADLAITGADSSTVVTLKAAKLVRGGFRFGSRVLRDNELGWVATRSFSTGTAGALCTLA